jgi:hypothetical protein
VAFNRTRRGREIEKVEFGGIDHGFEGEAIAEVEVVAEHVRIALLLCKILVPPCDL